MITICFTSITKFLQCSLPLPIFLHPFVLIAIPYFFSFHSTWSPQRINIPSFPAKLKKGTGVWHDTWTSSIFYWLLLGNPVGIRQLSVISPSLPPPPTRRLICSHARLPISRPGKSGHWYVPDLNINLQACISKWKHQMLGVTEWGFAVGIENASLLD